MSTSDEASPPPREDPNQISITLPEPMLQVVEDRLKGTIGTSRSDAIKTVLAIYLAENGLLDLEEAYAND